MPCFAVPLPDNGGVSLFSGRPALLGIEEGMARSASVVGNSEVSKNWNLKAANGRRRSWVRRREQSRLGAGIHAVQFLKPCRLEADLLNQCLKDGILSNFIVCQTIVRQVTQKGDSSGTRVALSR
jgi:hypothetical protein